MQPGNVFEDESKKVDGNVYRKNTNTSGAFHSNWLNMMYPRLVLARQLLADDGVMVMSIDDDEMPRLRMLGDLVFGPQNFYASIVWQKKYSPANDAKRFSDMHDYLVVYARSEQFVRGLFPVLRKIISLINTMMVMDGVHIVLVIYLFARIPQRMIIL